MSQKKQRANDRNGDLLGGLLELHLLNAAGENALTAKSAVERLAVRGHRTSEPAVITVLGDLRRKWSFSVRVFDGTARPTYALTNAGRSALRELKPHIKYLIQTIAGTSE